MYRIVVYPEAADQIAALPAEALHAYADVLGALELTPWNGSAMQPSPVGKHLDRAFGTGRWVYGDEAVVKRWPFAVVRDEVLLFECVAQCGDDLAGFMVVYPQ